MRPKVIDKDRLRLREEQSRSSRLSYELVFMDKDEVDEDLALALEKNNTQWEHRLIKERQKATEEGYKTGHDDGRKNALGEISQHVGTALQALNELDLRMEETIESIKPGITAMVFDLAEKVIGVPINNDELKNQVSKTILAFLKPLADETKAEIVVSEEDFDSVQHIKEKAAHLKKITIERDDRLKPGEFKVTTNHAALVNDFKKILTDFRNHSHLPDWALDNEE